jgi:hypothetical protein
MRGCCACGIACFFMCLMCHGVWLAIECDVVVGWKMCEIYNNCKYSLMVFL